MAFTSEPLSSPNLQGKVDNQPDQFDLPVKEFVGYDPKGTTSVTGSPLVKSSDVVQQPKQSVAAPIEKPAESTPEEVTLTPKLSAVARKDMAQRQKELALVKREKELESKLKDAEAYQVLKAKIEAKDYSAVDELGISYDEFVKHELNKEAGKDPGEQRFRKVEEELNSFKKQQEEQQVKEYQANQALWKQEIAKTIANGDDFSTIRELNAQDIVLQHVNDSFEEDGIELTVEQAAKDIEDALVERAQKFASVSKVRNGSSDAKVLGAPKTSAKTITQDMTVSSRQTKPKPFHLMSEAEQIQEAIRRVQAAKQQR